MKKKLKGEIKRMRKLELNYKETKQQKKEFVQCQRCKGVFRNDESTIVRIGRIGAKRVNCLKCNSEIKGRK